MYMGTFSELHHILKHRRSFESKTRKESKHSHPHASFFTKHLSYMISHNKITIEESSKLGPS